MDHVVHWDEVETKHRSAGDIDSRWTMLGQAAGSVDVGMRRIRIEEGKRSTAVHVHGAEEEIFFVLDGRGLLYQNDATCEVGAGDTIVHLAEGAAHALVGGAGGLDVLAFGTRVQSEICYLPRAGHAWAGPTVVAAPGLENLWKKDANSGPFVTPPPGPRPANVVALADVKLESREKGRTATDFRRVGRTAGAIKTGLNHVTIRPGAMGVPQHCHSAEEEMFVVLDGDGACLLGDAEVHVRRGHVISRPAGTGIAHTFRAGAGGLTFLAYGTRVPNDIAYYPRSNKVYLRGVGLIGRIERLDYWDGEV